MQSKKQSMNDVALKIYAIRGVVDKHDSKKSGWWPYRKTTPVVLVRFDDEQLETFNQTVRREMGTPRGSKPFSLPRIIPLRMSQEERISYKIHTEVEIVLGCANATQQILSNAPPITIISHEVVNAGATTNNQTMPPKT